MARMRGEIGYREDLRATVTELGLIGRDGCALLRAVYADPYRRAELVDRAGAGAGELERRLDAWAADGFPRARGSAYAAFFAELEAWTERWRWDRPGTCGRFHRGDGERVTGALATLVEPDGAYAAWSALALNHRSAGAVAARGRFLDQAARAEARSAALSIDLVLATTWTSHFGQQWAHLASAEFLDAAVRYGADVLPELPWRTTGDGTGPRPERVAMRDPARWFHWATALESAATLGGPDGRAWIRGLWMAGIAIGCAADFALRRRAPTRATYHNLAGLPGGLERRGIALAKSFPEAVAEVRDLFALSGFTAPRAELAPPPATAPAADRNPTSIRQD